MKQKLSNNELHKLYMIDRVGEVLTMNNGLKATIIVYRTAQDIDVQFSNNQIVNNTQYSKFKVGKIKCPMIVENYGDYCKVINPNVQYKSEFFIDTEDLDRVLNFGYWTYNKKGYFIGTKNYKHFFLHRFILNAPNNVYVDHKNMDKSCNLKSNLRTCTYAENNRNLGIKSNNTSGYKGVSWNKSNNKWNARVYINNKKVYSGMFDNKHEAALAYNEAAIKYHGEFARLNEIGEVQ